MEECFLKGPIRSGRIIGAIRKATQRTSAATALLCLLTISLLIASCGGGGNQGVSSEVVSGVAATGAPLAGEATIKDSSIPPREKTTVIASDGSFAFDVTDMRGPFILRAKGSAAGERHTLQSFAEGPGTANINPLANAAVASAAEVDDPEEVYENPNKERLQRISNNLSEAIASLLIKLKPLLMRYNADSDDPIRVRFKADHTRLDGLFDDVKITLYRGILTIINKKTGAVIFTGKISDILNGNFTGDDDDLPQPGSAPAAPAGVTAVGGAGQATVSWTDVGNAVSYNIYWSTTPGVTISSGTKITGATNPYVHTGLVAGTTYYYVVTAVNSAGESVASAEAPATTNAAPTPPPTVPAAPTGIIATGGTNQVTISWSAVSGADSYNIYWSTTSGAGTGGTKITGATSPTVQTGLTAGTTYYYVMTAVNSAGESSPSVQVAATTLTPAPSPTIPDAPTGVTAAGGANQVTISWSAVSGASSYNVYWSTTSGFAISSGTKIAGVTSPYVHTGLSAGTTYYYVVTAVNGVGESIPSAQASAITNAPAPTVPAAPTGVTATGGTKQVTISWTTVSGLTYNLYWSTTSGVTTATGTKIAGVTSPYIHTGLADGTSYYYIVTAVNSVGESTASSQVTATTNPPVPPPVSYSAIIQPILNTSCTGCHNSGFAAAGVRLTSYAETITTVTPGNAATSLLYRSLNGTGVAKMPPGGSLTAAQIQSFADWINQGALNN